MTNATIKINRKAIFFLLPILSLITSSCQDIVVNADQLDACTFSPPSGKLQTATDITITNSDPEALIYYTLDNSVPSESSTPYTGVINITDNTVIRARAYKASFSPSSSATGTYNVVWKVETQLPVRNYGYSVSYGGKLYIIGGTSGVTPIGRVDEYDFTSKAWSQKTDMPTARQFFGIEVYNGKIYCIGGQTYDGTHYNPVNTVEAYNIAGNSWETLTSMSSANRQFVTALYGDKIFCFGGYTTAYLTTCCSYDISDNSWSSTASLPSERIAFRAAASGTMIYCIGGYNPTTYQWATNTWSYNPVTDSWSQTLTNITTNRQELDIIQLSNLIYCFGGINSTGSGMNLKTNEVYNPSTNTWSTKSSIPFSVLGVYSGHYSIVSNGGFIYLLNPVSSNNLEVYRYNPTVD